MSQELVFINKKKQAVCSHTIISDGMMVSQDSTLKLIKKYKSELSEFGKVGFQIVPLKSGQKQKQYMLNEHQSTLLITLMRNNLETVKFKVKLVKQFAEMQDWIKNRIQSSLEYKVMSATLEDARKVFNKTTEPKHYMTEAKLVNWALKGCNKGGFTGLNRQELSEHEIDLLNKIQTRNTILIGSGMTYQQRKESLQIFAELNNAPVLEDLK